MMMLPDFNRLRAFYHVYLRRSVQQAATDLRVTRSAVSQSLKILEEEIGGQLFIRSPRSIVPTPLADSLFRVVDIFVRDLKTTVGEIRRSLDQPVGTIRIGAPLHFGSVDLAHAIADFGTLHPGITFSVSTGIPPELLNSLLDNNIDFAFIDNADIFAGAYPISFEPIATETFVMIASTSYYSKHIDGDHSFENIASCDFVAYTERAPVIRMWFEHHFGRVPPDIVPRLVINNVYGVLTGVSGGFGIGVVPEHLLSESQWQGNLMKLMMPSDDLANTVAIAELHNRERSYAANLFFDFCRKHWG